MPVIGSDNALVKISVQYLRTNDEAYNVYWYRATVDPDAANLQSVQEYFASFLPTTISALQASQWSCGVITVDVVNGTLAPYSADSGVGAGSITGENPMPIYNAFPIRLYRTYKDTRNGAKRIPGVTEEMVSVNGFESSVVTAWRAIEDDFADTFEDGDIVTWSPVIVRTSILGVPIEDPADYIFNPVASSQFINRVTTQNSRKPW